MSNTTHGNLIDVDVLKKEICKISPVNHPMDVNKCIEAIISLINNAPVVVPAGEPIQLDVRTAVSIFEKK